MNQIDTAGNSTINISIVPIVKQYKFLMLPHNRLGSSVSLNPPHTDGYHATQQRNMILFCRTDNYEIEHIDISITRQEFIHIICIIGRFKWTKLTS